MTIKVSKPEINIREALSDLKQDTGLKGQELMRADTVVEARTAIGAGRRNILINGDMNINQRGWVNGTAVGNGPTVFPADRWHCYAGWTWEGSVNDVILPNGVKTKSIRMLATSSGTSYWHPYQKVEVEDWMQGRTFTMSAWVRTTSPSNYFRYCDTVSCSTIGELIPNDGEWHYMTATYTTATTMSIGSSMQFQPVFPSYPYAGVQSGEFCEFALCQLELGSVATEFEHRSYGEELPLCQRYYQSLQIKKGVVGLGQNYQSRGQIGAFSLMTTMRVAPSISSNPTQISVDGGDGSHAFVFQSSKDSFHGYVDMGTGNVAGVTYSGDTHSAFTASIDAEL